MQCTLCMVQCESREKSTTSDQICLISFFQHAVRQRACIWRGWHVCCFRARLRWKMPALHVSSHSCFLFKAAPATTPRAETVTTKMLRLLVRSTQISVRQVSFNLKKKKNVTFMIFCCCCVSMVFCCGDGPRGSRGWHKLEISVWFG